MRALFHCGNFPCRKGLHDHAAFLIRDVRVLVPHRHRTGELAIGQQVGANFLAGNVHILGFVGGVAVEDTGRFMAEIFAQAIAEPLFFMHPGPLGFAQDALLRVALHAEPARTPAKVER